MHDRLYAADRSTLGRERYEKNAGALGLDAKKFQAALDAETGKAGIDADALAGAKVGASGTPTFFVNGKRLVAARSRTRPSRR